MVHRLVLTPGGAKRQTPRCLESIRNAERMWLRGLQCLGSIGTRSLRAQCSGRARTKKRRETPSCRSQARSERRRCRLKRKQIPDRATSTAPQPRVRTTMHAGGSCFNAKRHEQAPAARHCHEARRQSAAAAFEWRALESFAAASHGSSCLRKRHVHHASSSMLRRFAVNFLSHRGSLLDTCQWCVNAATVGAAVLLCCVRGWVNAQQRWAKPHPLSSDF